MDKLPTTPMLFKQYPFLKDSFATVVLPWNTKTISIRLAFADWLIICRGGTIKTRFDFTYRRRHYKGVVTFSQYNVQVLCEDGESLFDAHIRHADNVVGPRFGTQDLAVLVLQGGVRGTATDEEEAEQVAIAQREYEEEMADPNRKMTLGDLPLCDDLYRDPPKRGSKEKTAAGKEPKTGK